MGRDGGGQNKGNFKNDGGSETLDTQWGNEVASGTALVTQKPRELPAPVLAHVAGGAAAPCPG